MKIGLSINSVYNQNGSFKKIDGIGIYTLNLYQALVQENLQIKKVFFKNLWDTKKLESDFCTSNTPFLSLIPGNYYAELSSNINLLHITDYKVPRIKKTPIVSTIHDAIMLKSSHWTKDCRQIAYLKKIILKKLAHHADQVITCSQAVIPDIVHYWKIPEKKVTAIHHGIEQKWLEKIAISDSKIILSKYKITKPYLLTVGTLQVRKNYERIIRAYLSLPSHLTKNFSLIVVGKEHGSLTPPSLIGQLKNLENTHNVKWLQYIPYDELRCLYQNAELLLYPSLEEGFGFPILEGFASKIPVITSNCGSMAEISGNAAYLVDPHSQDNIADAIVNILENEDLKQSLIKRGQIQVGNFTWEKCARRTLEVYKKLL